MATSHSPGTTSSKSRRTVQNILGNELKMQKRNNFSVGPAVLGPLGQKFTQEDSWSY